MSARSIISIILACGFGAAAMAQSRPMPPDPYDPHHPQQTAQPVATTSAPEPEYSNNSGYDNGWPAHEVNIVPRAHAAQVFTRARFELARTTVYRVVDQLVEDFEYSADFLLACRTEKNAYERMEAARKKVIAQVAADRRYQTLQKMVADLSERLEDLKEQPNPSKDEILATAAVKLDYARKISEMESDALNSDSSYLDAKSRLREANLRVGELHGAFKRGIKKDATFVAARNSMDLAKIDFLAADAYFHTSLDAANAALDYAYWYNRNNYNYYPYYSYYPYSYYGYSYYRGW